MFTRTRVIGLHLTQVALATGSLELQLESEAQGGYAYFSNGLVKNHHLLGRFVTALPDLGQAHSSSQWALAVHGHSAEN